MDGLLDFGVAYVDSTKRQLRFSAFAVVNKIPDYFPLTKIVVLKAYRRKPHNGYCQNPEVEVDQILTMSCIGPSGCVLVN